ncbi:MAG: phosphoribosyltransferase family protein [Tissierellia bacterium]|nr:phosphoribosyltransferase family protein [Tissierellia bacterium]
MSILTELFFVDEHTCGFCREEPVSTHGICTDCKGRLEFVKGELQIRGTEIWCNYPLFYNNFLKGKVHAFKFQGSSYLYRTFGEILVDCYRQMGSPQVDLILPVPLHPRMERQRGYNQAALLARVLSERTGIPLEEHALKKTRQTKEQNKLSYLEREENLQDSIRIARPDAIKGKRLLLVDDFITTGATFRSLIDALLPAEPKSLIALALTSSSRLE